jgi:hypothetical protein
VPEGAHGGAEQRHGLHRNRGQRPLIAIFSTVHAPKAGGSMATTSTAARPEASTYRAARSSVVRRRPSKCVVRPAPDRAARPGPSPSPRSASRCPAAARSACPPDHFVGVKHVEHEPRVTRSGRPRPFIASGADS